MTNPIIARISQSAIQHNLAYIRKKAPGKKIIAMIKADAYGHGVLNVASAMPDVDALGVARIEEGILLREAGIKTDIVLMEGVFSAQQSALVPVYNFIQVIHAEYQIDYLKNINHPVKVWIKINTGMNRLGFLPSDFSKHYETLSSLKHVQIIGFMTHFANADVSENDFTAQQIQLFFNTVGSRSGLHSLANSAAIVRWPQAHGDWVRPGLILLGASPFTNTTGEALGLIPVMNLESQLIAMQWVGPGHPVGYGGRWVNHTPHDKLIGIVAMGYGDGYPLHAQDGTPVLIHDRLMPLVGRVSMDMMSIDLTSLVNTEVKLQIGDSVRLWGEHLPIETIAHHATTIPWELFCRLTKRVAIKAVR